MPVNGQQHRPRIALTMGDPCGVGPEIIVKCLQSRSIFEHCVPIIVGDFDALERALHLVGADLEIAAAEGPADLEHPGRPGSVTVISRARLARADLLFGQPSQATCQAVIGYIEEAARLALAGQVDAICTGPINKANLRRHGFPFPGHTEFLQELTGAEHVVMMLAGPRLRVALATIHHALAEVPRILTQDLLYRTIAITAEALWRDFGLETVRLGVAGINPHAGEEGLFGREEVELIQPVIQRFQGRAYRVAGPLSPDTLFHRAYEGEFDAVIAMYHDQGLIPIKLVHFHDAVNVTLGLPIVRTSVDHGTAYELAGTGKAHPGSLQAALRLASQMAHNRRLQSSSPGSP
jgi:4-hydroxythreonine-4-phosphate dehydrogenase